MSYGYVSVQDINLLADNGNVLTLAIGLCVSPYKHRE